MKKIPKVKLIFDIATESGRGYLRGIAKYNRINGGWALCRDTFYNRYLSKDLQFEEFAIENYDGIIANITSPHEFEYLKKFTSRGIPAIVSTYFKEQFPNLTHIFTDNFKVGRLAADYFLEKGFENFAYCGLSSIYWSNERKNGFKSVLDNSERIISFNEYENYQSEQKHHEEFLRLIDWLQELPKPVAMMVCNDDRGQDILAACRIAKIHVPEQIAIVGVDDDEMVCELSTPSLSSVKLNIEKAGFEAAQLLDSVLNGKVALPCDEIIVDPVKVVERQSSDSYGVSDDDVNIALSYIRQNVKNAIQVVDVVESTSLSRRALERRFKTILGRTILDEIRRVRSDKIAQLLIETNMSVMQIALYMNFNGIENVSRYFQQKYNMTPLAFRKKHK